MSYKKFKPAWWLRSKHLQTVWQQLMRKPIALSVRRERVELSDGDFIDVDWSSQKTGPIVIVLHGLEGSINSPYAQGLLFAMNNLGWRSAVMHFRGCSGEPNRLLHSYHSGQTIELDAF